MNSNALTLLDWIVLGAYFVFVVWLGARFRSRQKSSEDYFLGSRRVPGWAVSLTLFATIASSWTFLALPAKAFQADLKYLMAVGALPVVAWIGSRWFVPFFRERIRLTAYEYLESRFGLGARLYGNLTFLVVHFGKMSAVLYLLSLAVAQMTGIEIHVVIAVVGMATVAYSMLGGMEGVVWTDVVQGALMLLAGLVAVGFILLTPPGGPTAVVSAAAASGKFTLVSPQFSWGSSSTAALLVFGLNYFTQKYLTDQTIVQRYLLAPSTVQASRALGSSTLLLLGAWVLFMGLGSLLWGFYHLQPDLLPDAVRAMPDRVFPHFIGFQLPAGVAGLILAGLAAGSMSTLSSDLNSLSAVVYNDFYRRFRGSADEARHLVFSRVTVLVAGLLGVGAAMLMTNIHSMADAATEFVSLLGGGVMGVYLLGILNRRASAAAAWTGIGCGIAATLWAYFCPAGSPALPWLPRCPLHNLWVGLMGNVVVFACGWIASLAMPSRARCEPRVPDNPA